jgi:hypothetical protein
VAAVVGQRVYPVVAPASADLPFVTWRRTGVQRNQTLGGPMGMGVCLLAVYVFAVTDGEGYARGRVIGWLRAWEAVRDERGVEEADTLLAEAKAPPDISKYPFRMYASAEKGHRVMHDGKKFLITDEERADGKKRGL